MRQNGQYRRLVWTMTLLLTTACVLLVDNAVAKDSQGTQSITLTPSSTQVQVSPGSTVTRSFKVINSGGDDFVVDTSVTPYSVEGVTYRPMFTAYAGGGDASGWVTFAKKRAAVVAHSSATLTYTLQVPKNAIPGGYYAAVFATTSPVSPPESGIVPHNRVGNILYITVDGAVTVSGAVSSAPLKTFVIGDTIPFDITLHNTGNVHDAARVRVRVRGFDNQKLFDSMMERTILPQTERQFTTTWRPEAPIGIYTVSREIEMAGKTTTLPDKQIVVVRPLFFGLIVALALFIGLYVVLRGKRKSIIKKRT